ncbi:MAG: 4-oxalocrotonate tautomerase family protein [bacterium]|nr:4-oxalocrotonate tautomerase family protein [bacterium]
MPYVNVKVAGPLTREQKEKIAKDVAKSLEEHAGKPADHTYTVFDEVPRENWAKGNDLLG